MRAAGLLFLFTLAASGQEKTAAAAPPAAKSEKTVEQLEAEKRDPKKRAQALLDSAAPMAGAAQPAVQAFALMYIGDNYSVIDGKKALDYFRQAFAATAGLADQTETRDRAQIQAEIIRRTSELDPAEATSMLRQMQPGSGPHDPRVNAAEGIIAKLVQKKDYDRAAGLVETFGPSEAFPYRGVSSLIRALPVEDPRRASLFATAASAFSARYDGGFADVLADCWRDLPPETAQNATDTLVKGILALKEDGIAMTQTFSSSKGAVHFDSTQDVELFKVMHIVEHFDPKRAKELLESRTALRAALEKFPEGMKSMREGGGNMSISMSGTSGSKPDPQASASQQLSALSQSRAAAALQALQESPQKAISMVPDIPTEDQQVRVLSAIALATAGKDPTTSSSVLTRCIAMLDKIKEPESRVDVWMTIAEAAHNAADDQLAWKAIDRLLSDAGDLYKKDSDKDEPNIAMREYWPSTQAYRKAVLIAARLFSVDAEPLLVKITDVDLQLLGRPRQGWSVNVNHGRR